MFEKAARKKLRFNYKGQISAEDLWDLSLGAIDSIYKNLRTEESKLSQESLMADNKTDKILALKIEIVKHVFTTKKAELEKADLRKKTKETKQKIMEILSDKQNEAYKSMTPDQLTNLLKSLDSADPEEE